MSPNINVCKIRLNLYLGRFMNKKQSVSVLPIRSEEKLSRDSFGFWELPKRKIKSNPIKGHCSSTHPLGNDESNLQKNIVCV